MAGTIPLSLTQQLDEFGKPLGGGLLYIIQASTVATPQQPYQDYGKTIIQPNPIPLDAAGRVPQFFVDDGFIKFRLVDKFGVTQKTQDNVLVIGPSSGGGGGGGVDPTTVLQTGMLVPFYGKYAQNVLAGFARCNGLTIGPASSSATERNAADTLALFTLLWNNDPNLVVVGGRGGSAALDWANGTKHIALPDLRGRTIIGLDDMGNAASGRLTVTYWGGSGIVIGQASGSEFNLLDATRIPAVTFNGTTGNDAPDHTHQYIPGNNPGNAKPNGTGTTPLDTGIATQTGGASTRHQHPFSGAINGGGLPHANMPPGMLTSFYIKL